MTPQILETMRSSTKRPRVDPEELSPDGGYLIKTYKPTMEQMKDFSAYIKLIHDDNGHRAGLAKIIPPPEYKPRKAGYSDDTLYNLEIKHPIKQEVNGESGLFQQLNLMEKKKIKVKDFKRLAEDEYATPLHSSPEELERIFWRNIRYNPSIYGADVSGTLYDNDVEEFNLTRLNTILDHIKHDYSVSIEGVNTAYLYFGMWKTSFCWHTEDMDLYSINYLHEGEPKFWYCISPEHGKRFERLAASFFPHSFRTCRAFLRHKTTLISPAVLRKYSIPFSKCIQQKGEFMITFPYSYHSGFNCGFNIAEATNFALEHWIEFGKWATRCECSTESVHISMQTFVKRYQSDRYENWIRGKDIGPDPRDPRHKAAAPRPNDYDLYLKGAHERNQEEEENKSYIALQQIEESNVKIKTKAARKAYPSLEETYHRYKEFLQRSDPGRFDLSMQSSYSPLSNQIDHLSYNHQDPNYNQFNCSNQNVNLCQDTVKKSLSKNLDEVKDMTRIEVKKRKKEKPPKEKKMKDHVVPSKELLQFLPLTFTHEKRFNRCIAALYPHCSVCQLLEPHPKDNENIWGPMTPKVTDTIVSAVSTQPTSQETSTKHLLGQILSDEPAPITPVTAGPQVEEFKLPSTSPILIPRNFFTRHAESRKESDSRDEVEREIIEAINESCEGDSGCAVDTEFLDLDLDSSTLLQCSVCMLCVHKTCYGMDKTSIAKPSDWTCDRCNQRNRSLVYCELCPCRGGALKEIDGVWMHITCALAVKNFRFIDLMKQAKEPKVPQDLEGETSKTKLPESLEKNPCVYCTTNTSLTKYVQGRCIKCSGYYGIPCSNTYHPTCGHRNGATFDITDMFGKEQEHASENPIRSTCHSCVKDMDKISKETKDSSDGSIEDETTNPDLDTLAVGSRVVAKYKDNLYDGEIVSYEKVVYFEVFFPSQNTVELMIDAKTKVHDYDPNRIYSIGDEVKLNSRDEPVGKYKGQMVKEEYLVKFDDGPSRPEELGPIKVERRYIFVNIDQVPEELIDKFKGATNMDYLSTENDQPTQEQNAVGSDTSFKSSSPDEWQ